MRSSSTSPLTVIALAFLLVFGTGLVMASEVPGPFESTVDHEAGYLNTTFTDSASNKLGITVFYPAQTEGENTTKDVSSAPYPLLLIIHHPGVRPPITYFGSYGEHLSKRGYVVALLDLGPDQGASTDWDALVNSSLDALDHIADEDGTSGSNLYGMVDTSATTVLGHGRGGWIVMKAAQRDTEDRVHGVATIRLDKKPSAGSGEYWTEDMEIPVLLIEGSIGASVDSTDAFDQKPSGHISYVNIAGANFTQFTDDASFPWNEPPASINHSDQMNLTKKYLLAFLDYHQKGDHLAASQLYGNEAAADLEDGTLADWRYGVLDQSVVMVNPSPDAVVPPGPLPICATVSNMGPFPMASRNVTLEVAKVVPGVRAFQWVYGPENRTTVAMPEGGDDTLQWTPTLVAYGDYVAFISMDDPDHNSTNDRAQLPFTVAPLFPPTIEHVPPTFLELGEVYNLTCRLQATSTIAEAFVDYGDEDGFRHELPLLEDPVSGDFYVHLPAPVTTGQVNYKIHVRAGNGAWNITNPYYIPVLDTTPPTIEHTPPWTQLPVLSTVELNSTVSDLGGIDEVRLLYSEPSTGFHSVMCGRQGDQWFYPVVLGPMSGTMVYSWQATDTWGNSADSPTFRVVIEDEGPPLIEPVPSDPIELGDDVVLEAKVTDDSLLDEVWVTYKRPGETEEVNGTPEALGILYRLTVVNLTSPGTLTYNWWARDVNGLTTTSGDLEVEILDTVPPEISDIAWGDAIVGLHPWVQAEVSDEGGLVSVVVEYIDVFGAEHSVEMEEVLPDIFQASLTSQTMGGAMTFSITATDPSDNSARSGERTMVVRDLDPPEIVHVPPQDLVEGQEVTFEAEVTDNVGVAEVWLYLRVTASASYRRLAMENVVDDIYAYTLAEGELSQPHVLYYFEAEDLPPSSNMATDPLGAPRVSYLLNVTGMEMTLSGIVKASGGDPIEGATVNLVGHDTEVDTDGNGSYEIPGLVAGSYIIEVGADGFEPFTTTVLLSAETGDRELDVTLVPRSTGGGEDEALPWMMIAALGIFAVIALLVLIMMRSSAKGR